MSRLDNRTPTRELVARHMPGWSVDAELGEVLDGFVWLGEMADVTKWDAEARKLVTRRVFLDEMGAEDAFIDDLGYVRTASGRKL